jgi:hypothetical protein
VELRGFEPLTFSLRRCALLPPAESVTASVRCSACPDKAEDPPRGPPGGHGRTTDPRTDRLLWVERSGDVRKACSQPPGRRVRALMPAREWASTPRQSVPNADRLAECRRRWRTRPMRQGGFQRSGGPARERQLLVGVARSLLAPPEVSCGGLPTWTRRSNVQSAVCRSPDGLVDRVASQRIRRGPAQAPSQFPDVGP